MLMELKIANGTYTGLTAIPGDIYFGSLLASQGFLQRIY
jgi:hypothetical protein